MVRRQRHRIVTERLVVTGKAVEASIRASLALGLQFSDISTLPGLLDRERATDGLIQGIDIFDTDGKMLYSTDRLRSSRPVPAAWLAEARKNSDDWTVKDSDDAAAGISLNNNFGLVIGYLAIRYSSDRVRDAAFAVGRELAMSAFLVFLASAAMASLAVLAVMRGLRRDVQAAEAALRSGDPTRASATAVHGPFGKALQKFVRTTQGAEREIADLRTRMHGRGEA